MPLPFPRFSALGAAGQGRGGQRRRADNALQGRGREVAAATSKVVSSVSPPVLIVDDEDLIREALVMEFEDAGHGVRAAGSGDEAVALLSTGVEISVVITDIRMPGDVDGVALAGWLQQHRPRVPIIVLSGYASPELGSINPNVAAVCPKPCRPGDLVSLVRRLHAGG